MIAVCNTSPLILLAKIRRLDLLCQLYHQIVAPTSVLAEVTAKSGKEAERIESLARSGQCQVRQASSQAVKSLPDDLGPGERETIALALETRADLVILDDQRGRRAAREKGLTVTGTVGSFPADCRAGFFLFWHVMPRSLRRWGLKRHKGTR